MCDANVRPDASAAGLQPEAQITKWLEQAVQCPSWCSREHVEPDFAAAVLHGQFHDGAGEGVTPASAPPGTEHRLLAYPTVHFPPVGSNVPADRWVELNDVDKNIALLTAAEARELAAVLVRAADMLEAG